MNALRHFLLAIQFFTRIPVTGRLAQWVGFSPAMLQASAGHFPGVGWVVGTLSAAVFVTALRLLPDVPSTAWLAVVLSTAFSVWLTGAFHEDGLADTADGLGGMVSRERSLEIMKDSRIGSYGAVALVLALLTKVFLLGLLFQAVGALATAWALLLGHVFSRFLPLITIRVLPHVGDTPSSKSKPLAQHIDTLGLVSGLTWCAMALVLCAWVEPNQPWPAAIFGAVVCWLWMWRLLKKRLQGFTGDGLGATQQVCELGFYFGFALGL